MLGSISFRYAIHLTLLMATKKTMKQYTSHENTTDPSFFSVRGILLCSFLLRNETLARN